MCIFKADAPAIERTKAALEILFVIQAGLLKQNSHQVLQMDVIFSSSPFNTNFNLFYFPYAYLYSLTLSTCFRYKPGHWDLFHYVSKMHIEN